MLIKNIGDPSTGKIGLVSTENFGIDKIENNVKNNTKGYLADKNDLNSSRIGYSLSLIGQTSEDYKCGLMISYGSPKISGRDTININFSHELFANNFEDFTNKMNLIYNLFTELIMIAKPQKAIVKDYLLSKEKNINDMLVGYYTYLTGEISENIKIDNLNINCEQFEEGLLLKFKLEERDVMINNVRKFYEINYKHLNLFNNFGEKKTSFNTQN